MLDATEPVSSSRNFSSSAFSSGVGPAAVASAPSAFAGASPPPAVAPSVSSESEAVE